MRHNLSGMRRGQLAPVQGRKKVVHSVQAIVKGQKICDWANKVARHVVATQPHFAPVVLQEVHCHDPPLRKKVGQPDQDKSAAPIQRKQRDAGAQQHRPLCRGSALDLARRRAQIRHVELEDNAGDSGLEKHEVEPVPLIPHRRRAHGVAPRLCISMMAHIVARYKRACGVPIGQGEEHAPDGLEGAVLEARLVHGVVRDARAGKAQVGEEWQCGVDVVVPCERGGTEVGAGEGYAFPVLVVVEHLGLCFYFCALIRQTYSVTRNQNSRELFWSLFEKETYVLCKPLKRDV